MWAVWPVIAELNCWFVTPWKQVLALCVVHALTEVFYTSVSSHTQQLSVLPIGPPACASNKPRSPSLSRTKNTYVVAHVATVVLWSLPPSCVTSSISLVITSKDHNHTNKKKYIPNTHLYTNAQYTNTHSQPWITPKPFMS